MRERMVMVVLAAAWLLLGVAPARGGSDVETYERWYVLEMQDTRAGWSRTAREVDASGRVVTETEMAFEISRAGQEIRLALKSRFVETAEGEPVEMRSETNLGAGLQVETYEFGADGVRVVTEQGGRTTERREALPAGEWLTPREVETFVRKRLEAGAESITYATLDPTAGLMVFQQTHKVVERGMTVEAGGRVHEGVIRWEVTQNFMPDVVTTEYVDGQGRTLRSQVPFGTLKLDTILADKAVATARFEAPEIMVSTLVKPDRPIRRARQVRRATYVLSVPQGRLPDLPEGAGQRVERIDERSARVTVDMESLLEASEADRANADYREASTLIDSDDPAVRELVKRAGGEGRLAPGRAERMRRFVHEFIREKNLGVGFASASEVCRTREGDCSEHGVLLAAMLRADGIPSRVVSGLLYIDEFVGEEAIFGYHMWAQALMEVDGQWRWVDLDATLPASTPSDATHIAVAHASLAEGDMVTSMSAIATLMGHLAIEVEEASY